MTVLPLLASGNTFSFAYPWVLLALLTLPLLALLRGKIHERVELLILIPQYRIFGNLILELCDLRFQRSVLMCECRVSRKKASIDHRGRPTIA